jgi:hypothetical protein
MKPVEMERIYYISNHLAPKERKIRKKREKS